MANLYFSNSGGVKLYRLLEQFSHDDIIRFEMYDVDYKNSTLLKHPVQTGHRSSLETQSVEVDEDVAQGIIMGIWEKIG